VHAKGDIKPFEQWLATFKHPKDLRPLIQYNIKHHLAKLTIQVNKARKDLAEQKWTHLGEDLGVMLAIATTPIPSGPRHNWLHIEIESNILQ